MEISYKRWTSITKRVITINKGLCISGERCNCNRSERSLPTTEAQKRVNYRKAQAKLSNKINNNFSDNDIFVTFTYDNSCYPNDEQTFKKNVLLLVRSLKYLYHKLGLVCRYIYVLEESKEGRYHIHMILNSSNSIDYEMICNRWKKGSVDIKPLYHDYNEIDYSSLANYLLKTSNSSEEGRYIGRRWNCSDNLQDAEVVKEDIKETDVLCIDEIPEGYYLIGDSYSQGIREYDGTPYAIFKIAPFNIVNSYYNSN